MKKKIGFFYVFILLQISLTAQILEMDFLLFQKLNNELLNVNDEVILDLDVDNDLKNETSKLKSILYFILENKNQFVELSSHTSCVGNPMVNIKISEARAEKLNNKIFNLADSSDFPLLQKNFTVKGYGGLDPLIKCECAHCSKQSLQQNDRIVLKLIRVKNIIGLKGREAKGPSFDPNNQVEGKIAINICVDKDGFVIRSKTAYVSELSTIDDPEVITQAMKAANRWYFKPSEEEIACGTITYVIKIK